MKRIVICIFLFSFKMQGSLAQTQNNAIGPLPSNAAELFKYNSIPVSPMTGVPNISYKLYEINTKDGTRYIVDFNVIKRNITNVTVTPRK